MLKTINVTIPNASYELLQQIKKRKSLPNNAEAFVWIIQKAAGVTSD